MTRSIRYQVKHMGRHPIAGLCAGAGFTLALLAAFSHRWFRRAVIALIHVGSVVGG